MWDETSRAEIFLKRYRVLEGLLEKKYLGKRQNSSVIMEYLRDPDSEPVRYELNLCREIRNLLSHNADEEGEPLVEPSQSILDSLEKILTYVSQPRLAIEYGTPQEKILWAHANDLAIDIMHRMNRCGYSHVPVMQKGKITGVFSAGSLFAFLERRGFSSLEDGTRIGQIKETLDISQHGSEKYIFMAEDSTIDQVRAAFEARAERNSRLSAVFITEGGSQEGTLLAMLTPWDVLKDA